MSKRHVVAALLASAAAALATSCVATLWVPVGPPPEQVEIGGAAPGPGFIWVDGWWTWRSRWIWEPGHWARPPHASARWERGHWDRGQRGWRWTEGRWR
jgi:hypothetical protein